MSPETPPPEAERTGPPARFRGRMALGLLLAALLAGGGAGAYRFLQADFNRPARPGRGAVEQIEVRPGMGLRQVAGLLGRAGLIARPRLFRLQVRLRGGAERIRSGVYELRASMSPRAIYRALLEGRVAQRTFTIPEGFSLREIARAVRRAGLDPAGEIPALARERAFLEELGVRAPSLEGYLFPDTYRFPLRTPPRRILRVMVQTLKKKAAPLVPRARALGFTLHQVLTLASIVEKETALDAERPLIAAVFLNRLKKGMRLQSDPTVIYGLPGFDGNLRKRDLGRDSPYNTYVRSGLPPGPIASPGLASIRAVLQPANADYLYFVATRKGGHKFSRTYREHRRAVARYQLGRRGTVDP